MQEGEGKKNKKPKNLKCLPKAKQIIHTKTLTSALGTFHFSYF